jgi:uncharacterized repeat protein (TIGR03803 family)
MKHRISIFANTTAGLTIFFFAFTLLGTGTFAAAQETVLHSFSDTGTDGYYPQAGVTFDAKGNLYGTTTNGGANNLGTVFKVNPRNGDEVVLEDIFVIASEDGSVPYASLTFDPSGGDVGQGIFWGTTTTGGTDNMGTFFTMSPTQGNTGYEPGDVYSFNGTDGANPYGSLLLHPYGAFGTTAYGGAHGSGIVWDVEHGNGFDNWGEKILHAFNNNGKDGTNPFAAVIIDASGNLYGTTPNGGANGNGTVYRLTPKTTGPWAETILYSFNENGTDGYNPYAGLVMDGSGNLYGTTISGGTYNGGIVYELTPTESGSWTETILHNFNVSDGDGFNLNGSLIFDASGNLYGTTVYGGTFGAGTVFELSPPATGQTAWTETILYSFENTPDGAYPLSNLVFDSSGNLYGTTQQGGTNKVGTVFRITP